MQLSDWPLFALAHQLPSTGDFDRAEQVIRDLLLVADELSDQLARAVLLMEKASLHRLRGSLRDGLKATDEAVAVAERLWNPWDELGAPSRVRRLARPRG